ncbi:MAG: NAD-dependent epimerase/dehydratase family protein [Leptolyngbya sp. SIOISBB]|nr:NAD-dependent epimerase/dehydratase family protein [Leptolyngbya sp. SIOISBB]
MGTVIITGSAGLIGSQSVHFFAGLGFNIVGIDNDMRALFFGDAASTSWNKALLIEQYGDRYQHKNIDIRDRDAIESLFKEYGADIELIIHTAAQPSHDWAANDPHTDFTVNANGTLVLLEATRQFCSEAVFIFTSTNKVYGDTPNNLPLEELDTRWEIMPGHAFYRGIDETMSIDHSKHSLFGASKVAADVLVQEYGHYFGMKTGSFRGGCLTGPLHSGAELHGFLAYLVQCAIARKTYTIFGYKGKQVRDNIHSYDLVNAFYHFYQNPRCGEVYNLGGSRHSNCSMLEAIALCEEFTGNQFNYQYSGDNRIGDHIWYISDVSKFQKHYPQWQYKYALKDIFAEVYQAQVSR